MTGKFLVLPATTRDDSFVVIWKGPPVKDIQKTFINPDGEPGKLYYFNTREEAEQALTIAKIKGNAV